MESAASEASHGFSITANSMSSDLEQIVDPSLAKQATKSIFSLITYFDNYISFPVVAQIIVSYWKMIQLLGPALIACSRNFWVDGSLAFEAVSILSVFFHIIPSSERPQCREIFMIIYIIIMFIYYLVLVGSSLFYHKEGKLNPILAKCINFFLYSFEILLPPIGFEYVGEFISLLIKQESEQQVEQIVLIVLAGLITIFHFVIHYFVGSQAIIFRTEPTPMLEGYCQVELIGLILIVTFISGLASFLDPLISGILYIVDGLIYLYGYKILYEGSFINITQAKVFYGCMLSSCIFMLIEGVVLCIGETGSELYLFLFFFIFIISMFVANFHINYKIRKDLITLDLIDENGDNIDMIKSVSRFANISITGFSIAHPAIATWSIFKEAQHKWPENLRLLIIYAKYAAIYPDEKNTLQMVARQILDVEKETFAKDQAIQQIQAILRTREPNLTIELKQKISKMNNHITRTKHKMRNLWDILLQGNVKELVAGLATAYDAVCECDIEIDQLLKQFPNNRFVSRLYSRFLKDVKAEYQLAKEWNAKTKDICMSKSAQDDHIQKAGLLAFPNSVHTIKRLDTTQNYIDNDNSETNDDQGSATEEDPLFIGDTIASHKIQVIRWSYCILTFNVIVFMFLPIIVLVAYFLPYIDDLAEPLDHMYALSYVRMLNFLFSAFGQRYCMEKLPSLTLGTNPMAEPIDFSDTDLSFIGNSGTCKGQITHFLRASMSTSNAIAPIRTFKEGNALMDQVREILFTPSTIFKYYPDGPESQTQQLLPAETICTTVSQYLSQLIELDTIDADTLLSIMVLTATTNVLNPGEALSNCLTLFINYISDIDERDQTVYLYVAIALSCAIFIDFLVSVIVILKRFESNKKEIFDALSSLPKTVISSISASFSVIEKKQTSTSATSESDNELNKQEEKALKMFTSISDDTGGVNSMIVVVIMSFLMVVCSIAAIVETCLVYMDMSTVLIENAPHIDYLGGAMSYIGGMFNNMGRMILGSNGYTEYEQSSPGSLDTFKERAEIFMDYYHLSRFGGEGSREFPFIGMIDSLDSANTKNTCPDDKTKMRGTFLCLDTDLQVYFFRNIMNRITYPYEFDNTSTIAATGGTGYDEMWFLAIHLYNTLFAPMLATMVDTIVNDLNTGIQPILATSISMLVLIVVFYIVSIISIRKINNQLMFGIGLLKFCPESAIQGSPRLLSLLSGHYGFTQDDTTERNAAFYDTLVHKLSDIVIICKKDDLTITTTNAAFDEMFSKEPDSCIGREVKSLLAELGLKGRIDPIFEKSCQSLLSYQKDETTIFIAFSSLTIGEYIFINGRDQTREMKHMQLIQDERSKSDAMLRTIIPVSLVSRVQAGESNISFSVQSASVLFLDIVSFTPWCGGSTAEHVMLTLNTIFSYMDEAVATHATLMRMKCIGDCYMAAGGIFSEGDRSEIHAKEMVEFGIEAIHVIERVNSELNENLKIRVGINTGGPIVAGIIGTAKPTFEILGPTINMAQQMEHHGIPMNVQITRSVYELIYGGSFKIKERGEIECKDKKVLAYIVSPE